MRDRGIRRVRDRAPPGEPQHNEVRQEARRHALAREFFETEIHRAVQTRGAQPIAGAHEGIEATRIAEAALSIGNQPAIIEL